MKSDNSFENKLKKEALNIGIELDLKQLNRFKKYMELLIEWNEKMNLTAITDEYQIIMKHFIDCLEVVKYINKGDKIIDVGTGAGFPGIVIAIYFDNNIEMTLLDSLNKRITFLSEVVDKLDLQNIKLTHGRAEEYAHDKEYRSKYDLVVSRAVASLDVLLEYDIAYLKLGGKALLLKGNNAENEINYSKKAFDILGCKVSNNYNYSYKVEEELYNRTIIEIEKKEETKNKYPRSYGKIKKNPLK